jgi:sugar phosphate isomerase/epimerase
MTPCLWTSIYVELSPEDALRRLADIGWTAVELSCEHIGAIAIDDNPLMRARKLRELADGLGISLAQAHLLIMADVASSDAALRDRCLDAVHREMLCCAEMGIPVGVLHPGGAETAATQADEDFLTSNRIAGFTKIASWAEAARMRIAIENMADRIGVGAGRRREFGAVIADLLSLIEAVGSPLLGICLDTSHANVQGLDMRAAVLEAGGKLIALHVSDNDGSGDQHRTPYSGKIDWPKLMSALGEIGYQYPFNLEIPGERGCPYEVLDSKARHALTVAQWLTAR